MAGLISVGYFLLSLLFGFAIMLLWLRIALRFFNISSLHPINATLIQVTRPLVLPFVYLFSHTRKYTAFDWPAFLSLILIEFLKFIFLGYLLASTLLPFLYLVVLVIADLIIQPLNILFYAILIRVVMSWVNPMWNQPITFLLVSITEPFLRIPRRYIPYMGAFDISPLIVLLVIKCITIFIATSLPGPML
jgi:YggT family protein